MANQFFVAPQGMSLVAVLAELAKRVELEPWFPVVVRASDGQFYVLDYRTLTTVALGGNIDTNTPLDELASNLGRPETQAVQHNALGPRGLQNLLLSQASGYLVLLAGDTIQEVLRRMTLELPQDDKVQGDKATSEPSAISFGEVSAPEPHGTEDKSPRRQINGWIAGLGSEESLSPGMVYELLFDVAEARIDARLGVAIERELEQLTVAKELVEITVIIDPLDFTLYGVSQQILVVPTATSPSKNRVMFTIESPVQGPASLVVMFLLDGRLFQRHILSFQIGEGSVGGNTTRVQGITLESATRRIDMASTRRVTLQVLPIKSEGGGYRLFYLGTGVYRATLDIDKDVLDDWVQFARKRLAEIVTPFDREAPKYYHQVDLTIQPDVAKSSLRALARLGRRLFDNLFGSQRRPDVRELGQALKELSQHQSLVLQIAAEHFFFPWALLYDGDWSDDPDWTPDWRDFWGFKHVIECLPEYSLPMARSFDPVIQVRDRLAFAFVYNTNIDAQYGPFVANQRTTFAESQHLDVREYQKREEFLELLRDPQAPALLYCYCHAKAYSPREGEDGVEGSFLELSDGPLTLRDMRDAMLNVLPPPQFLRAPLVFINACQSVRLSPYLYDGLMPFLLQLGARGVLGTEIDTPAPFAAAFAKELLERFTAGGQPLGALLLAVRHQYMHEHNNFLGLLYTLYCSGDVVVERRG